MHETLINHETSLTEGSPIFKKPQSKYKPKQSNKSQEHTFDVDEESPSEPEHVISRAWPIPVVRYV